MLEIAAYGIKTVVYYDFKADANSSINNDSAKETLEIARVCKVKLKKFKGKLQDV
jgi:hypothetical protein